MLIKNEDFNINRDVLCRSLLAHFYPAGDYVHLLQPLALCINFFYAGLGLLKDGFSGHVFQRLWLGMVI